MKQRRLATYKRRLLSYILPPTSLPLPRGTQLPRYFTKYLIQEGGKMNTKKLLIGVGVCV